MEDRQNDIMESFQSLFGKEELFARVIECFPYPIQIFSLDGTARMVNKAALEVIGIRNVEDHIGKYNVFQDPIVRNLGVVDQVRQVLKGKTIYSDRFQCAIP